MRITHTTYTAMPPHTTFLYPHSRQYPVDEVCEKIVRALEKRNWNVSGIQVEFSDSGNGEENYRQVYEIKAEDFKLWFSRIQGMINSRENDCAAIAEIIIPKKELGVYEDESGPTYYTYVGNNWENDKKSFMNDSKVNSKLDNKPRTYLQYNGSCSCKTYYHSRHSSLVNYDDFGREYKAREGEPTSFRTDQVFQEFNEWLQENVLQKIESVEEATNVEPTTEPNIPYPKELGPFYVKIGLRKYNRIIKGKENKDQLKPSERYALRGGGNRLVSLGIRNDESIPEKAYDGFKYCSLKKPELEKDDTRVAVVRISPKNANNIFVADNAPARKYKEEYFKQNPNMSRLPQESYEESRRCSGRTIVPIHQYKGNYEDPVVLIEGSRELSFDEVEILDVTKQITI